MSFWGRDKWISANEQAELVDGFDCSFLKDGAYRLSIGEEAILSSNSDDREQSYKKLVADEVITVRPGQFAFLITKEMVYLPKFAMGFINIATGTKLKGLINISGFHVDPGYRGKLIFSVFNAGPTSITLAAGQRMFRLWLSDYDHGGEPEQVSSLTSYSQIPREWADALYGSFPSPFSLSARVSELEKQVNELRSQKNALIVPSLILALFLGPFVAGLYANVLASAYTWITNSVSSVDQIKDRQTLPDGQKPAPIIPPAANTPSTASKPDAAAPPPPPSGTVPH